MTSFVKTAQFRRLSLVVCSLILSLAHFGPLQGTVVALLLTVGGQVYLFGYLAARALGLLRESESIVIRVVWIVTCGLGISIVLGAFARLVVLPVGIYVVGIHILMMLLALVSAEVAPVSPIERKTLPIYLLLGVTCIVFIFVGRQQNRVWLDGFDDQSLPVSMADWWAHQAKPENVISRQIGQIWVVGYWSTDGLTYTFASWIWAGNFSAVQLIWYALTPLFAGLVPLAHYALAYRITKRADTAAWTAGMILVLALTTIKSPTALYGGAWMFGQEAAFQLDTLRTFSTALLMPLAFFVFFSYMRSPSRPYYWLTGIILLALALTHPRQFLAVFTGLCAILALNWLMAPSRARLRRAVLLGLVLLPALAVPFWQYAAIFLGLVRSTTIGADLAFAVSSSQQLVELDSLLFHPLIPLALCLGLVSVVYLRRSLAAQFVFSGMVLMFALSFVPPIFNVIRQLLGIYFGLHYVLEMFYLIPYGLILGIAISFLHDYLKQHLHLRPLVGDWVITGGFIVFALALLAEPFPIAQSTRDQISAANASQALRDIHPFDEALLTRLRALPVPSDKVVYVTPNRVASYVIESVPNAFITGGREENNLALPGSSRFFESPDAPWLDAEDIAFLQKFRANYLVIPADNTRIPQLLLQPERFAWVDTVAGYLIFQVRQIDTITDVDRTFAQMNTLYQADPSPRWGTDGFHLDQQANADHWQPIIAEWQKQLADDPANDDARYGLAFATLLSGSDQNDEWASLSEAHPDIFLMADAHAQLLLKQGQAQAATNILLGKLETAAASQRVLSARELLTETFVHHLTPEQVNTVLALETTDATTWMHLMEWANAVELRLLPDFLEANADKIEQRAKLLTSLGHADAAQRWLSQIPGG